MRKTPPADYTELMLCRDVYHCTPSMLAEQDWLTIQRHIAMLNVESEMNRRR